MVTNLFQEHVDYHGNVKNYWAAKKNIINYQTKNGGFVYNPGNKESIKWLQNYHGKAVPFSQKKYQTSLIGPHNQENIGAAVAVAQMLKIPASKIQAAVKSFKALPHRLELVGTFKGITFINDANATIPEATVNAIKSVPNNIHNVVLFPDSGNRMIKNTGGLTILKTKSMKEAVKFAYQHTQKGKVCLLSCASPSYSLWKNFEEKGDEFKKFVKDETSR